MASITRQIKIPEQPDFFLEARHVMAGCFRHQAEQPGLPFAKRPLVSRPDRFAVSPKQMADKFSDVCDYLRVCRTEAEVLLADNNELAALFLLQTNREEAQNQNGFLEGVLASLLALDAAHMSLEDFAQACLEQVQEWAGGEEAGLIDVDIKPDLHQALELVSLLPMNDAQRMSLLRFFSQMDAWYERIRSLLIALEDVCRQAYPKVATRFARKVKELQEAGAQAQPLQWLARMGTDFAALRPEEPLVLQASLIQYNSLGLRFSERPGQPLRVSYGVLFSELDELQDQRRARDEITERQLRALADASRLAVVRQLAQGEKYVQELADSLGLSPATLSHHLNALLQAFLVGVRVEGRRSYYHLNRKELDTLAQDLRCLSQTEGDTP